MSTRTEHLHGMPASVEGNYGTLILPINVPPTCRVLRFSGVQHIQSGPLARWPHCATSARYTPLSCRVMFPPGPPPPGVHVSEDGASVATPVCPMEWFLSFYEECCELYGQPEGSCSATETTHCCSGAAKGSFVGDGDSEQLREHTEGSEPRNGAGEGNSRQGRRHGDAQPQGSKPRWYHGVVSPCLLYTSPSPRDRTRSRMPSSA